MPFLKAYSFFNVDQIESLHTHFYALAEPKLDAAQRIDPCRCLFAATGSDVCHGGNEPYHALQADQVQMPPFECFEDPEADYAALDHDRIHWTGTRPDPTRPDLSRP